MWSLKKKYLYVTILSTSVSKIEVLGKEDIKMIKPYERNVKYYETDQMAIVNHANYIHWFEEARIYYMEQNGIRYKTVEERGIIIPVLGVNIEYKRPTRFGETVLVTQWLTKFSQVKFEMTYEVIEKETGELCAKGKTSHCFLDKDLNPIRLKKDYPDLYEAFQKKAEEDKLLLEQRKQAEGNK